jgi:hypothetical protein
VETALAWIAAPLLLLALCAGLGLLVEALTRFQVADALVAPLGFCLGIVVAVPLFQLGFSTLVVTPALVLLAAAGVFLRRAELPARLRLGPAAYAGLGAFALYLAPVALSGSWTWAGYNFTNDPANTLTAAEWILHHGYNLPAPDSTSALVARGAIDQAYPLGSHLLMGTVAAPLGLPVVAFYTPFIAFVAGLIAASFTQLARSVGVKGWWAAAAAVLATGGNLIYAYGALGGLKEIATVAIIAAGGGIATSACFSPARRGAVAAVVVTLAALVPVLSAGGVAYAGLLGLVLLAVSFAARPRPALKPSLAAAALGAVLFLVLAGSSLVSAASFASTAQDAIEGQLGQLLRPLPLGQAGGIWWAADWRGPVDGDLLWGLNRLSLFAVFALGALGLVLAVRRRSAALIGVLATAGVTAALLAPRTSPYGDSKLLVILTPFVVLLAGIGLWTVRERFRAVAMVIAVLLAGALLYSDALIYRSVRLAPIDRMSAMEDVADRSRGMGLVLHNENEEWLKYFYRNARGNSPTESWIGPKPIGLLENVGALQLGTQYDLDQQKLAYQLSFNAIVTRRGPAVSRPPASFRSVYRNRYYELWRQDRSVQVRDHLGSQGPLSAQAEIKCSDIRRFAAGAQGDERLLAAELSPDYRMKPGTARDRPLGWPPLPALPGTVDPHTPGHATQVVDVPAGRYRVWLYGSSGRRIDVNIDGRLAGSLKHTNTSGQWIDVAVLTLGGGRHEVEVVRPGGSLGPGNAYAAPIGPVALEPLKPERLVSVAPGDARSLCFRKLDWVERVSGQVSGATAADATPPAGDDGPS